MPPRIVTRMSACQLCASPGPIASRNFGLDLCEPCSAGYLTGRLGCIGAELTVEEIEVEGRDGETRLELRVVGTMHSGLPLMVEFGPRTVLDRLRGMLRKGGFRSGDPLFDHRVQVKTRSEPLLRTLIANDGFQSAVMSLVTVTGGFEIRPGHLEVRASLEDLDLRAEVPLAVASILRHLANQA